MLQRNNFLEAISNSFDITPICGLLGPRQCGKTTIAKEYIKTQKNLHPNQEAIHFFDLEDPIDLSRLDNPKLALEQLKGLIVIDEIQRRPDLFPVLRVLVDRTDQKYLILGSASQELIRQSSESLAGRINYIEMTPFSFLETQEFNNLWVRGGFPRSYLASSEGNSNVWRKTYIKTFLEKDIASFGFDISPQLLRRFWMMLALSLIHISEPTRPY